MTTRSPFPPSSSSFSSSSSSSWSHRFFTFLRLLSFNPAQFTRLLEQYAQWFDGTNQPYSTQWHSQFLRHHGKPVKRFTVRPTVLLQAVVPFTGFAVTFRAMLDSGAYASFISRDLAALLLEEGGATEEYIWPAFIDASFYPKHTLLYRRLCNLQLKSVDEKAEEVVEQFTLPFVNVKDSITYWVERLPVGLLISKMASLGLPVVTQKSQKRGLERSMLWPKERKANSQYRVDMLIGQDLLNAHFNVHPCQPTYHISPSLVLFRTKMGLAFMGQFDTEKFKQWTNSKKKAKEMKIALYSFTYLLDRYAESFALSSTAKKRPDVTWILESTKFKAPKRFTARPTVLLRAVLPSSTTTSVTFRGLLDSGADFSVISRELANVLLKNEAENSYSPNVEYIWPAHLHMPFYQWTTMLRRRLCNLTLQSVEAEEGGGGGNAEVCGLSVVINDDLLHHFELTPIELVMAKMASLGLPLVSKKTSLGETMWSKRGRNSQYCVDMLIGQDLLNAHFNFHPCQPTYHISPSLVLFRTKMGLAFMGQFDKKKFKQWTMNCLMYLFIYVHFFALLLLLCSLAPVLKLFIVLIGKCSQSLLFFFQCLLSLYLSLLLEVALTARDLYEHCDTPTLRLLLKWLISGSGQTANSFSISPQMMSYRVPPRLPVTVRAAVTTTTTTAITKAVKGLIDTGAPCSWISESLARNLEVPATPAEVVQYADGTQAELVDVEVGGLHLFDENQNQTSSSFTKIRLQRSSIAFFSSTEHSLQSSQVAAIARLLDIPLIADHISENSNQAEEQLLIGADLLPLLMRPHLQPSKRTFLPSFSFPRVIPITSNLNAVKTRLGYYLQGTQYSSSGSSSGAEPGNNSTAQFSSFNWSYRKHPFACDFFY
ncbi:hypothetical protein TYRP_006363 [Tyrophagus putrescentiae]|nr:hypothetical protein TYRP_006363 [Tyrophagus putrescentiae]